MTSPRSRQRPLAAAVLGLLAASVFPLLGQAPEERFTESIEVSVVNLDVFVSDKKGRPITGLKREDFEVYEDGKPVEITNFYAETGPAREPETGAAPQAPAARPAEQLLRLVIFVDDVNTAAANRGAILDRLTSFLRSELRPGDKVMLVRYGRSLEILRQFTADVGRIETDVAGLKKRSADLGNLESSHDFDVEQIAETAAALGGWEGAESEVQAYAQGEERRVAAALDALGSVVSWLAGTPGRKAILYVSDGLPLVPGGELFEWGALRSGFRAGRRISGMTGQSFDATERFRQLTFQASRNHVTLYPIEAGGTRMVRGTMLQEALVQNRQNGLRFLAEETGGRAMLNAADPLAALGLLSEDLTAYYSLGYQPPRPGDEVKHEITVKVKVKGAQVRQRQWYRDKPVSEAVAERTLAVMRFGPEDNPLGVKLEIGTALEQGDSVLLPLRVKVPIAKVYLQPGEGKRSGRLRVFVVASGEGTTTPVRQSKLVTLEVPESELAAGDGREYTHEIQIPMKKGRHAIGVGVRDELAAVTSYLRKDFVVGEAPAVRRD